MAHNPDRTNNQYADDNDNKSSWSGIPYLLGWAYKNLSSNYDDFNSNRDFKVMVYGTESKMNTIK